MGKSKAVVKEAPVKVTLVQTLAGPDGCAKPGTVLDVSQQKADELLKARAARMFDRQRDEKAPRGLTKAGPVLA